jgi:hypothetical protein
VRVKMLRAIMAVVEAKYVDVQPGDVIDIDLDARAEIWIAQKLAVAVDPNTPTTARLKEAGLSGGDSRYAHY